MTKVELHPAILFHCNFCSEEGWHNCTLRTGMEALTHMIGSFEKAMQMDRLIKKIQQRCHESDMRCPPLPDLGNGVLIQARLHCKNCGSTVGSIGRGFSFICDDCGKDNYFLPKDPPRTVECQHCHSRFGAEHFLRGLHDED